MQIKLLNLKLKNFKGIKDLEINFEGKSTNIYGRNATGKTTIFDAFKWLFFDKDSSDRKDFNIKTLDKNNQPIHFLEHGVEAVLLIDGQDTIFKKVFHEKWVKRRGQEQQEFAGHETSYWIDEVPIKKKDYEEKINSIIPENLFKLITDPSFFNNQMTWKERRELLTHISGTNITDEDILDTDDRFEKLKENLQGRTIEDYKKVVNSKIKELNKQKETIPVRIDELTKTLITDHEINYEELQGEKEKYNQELSRVEENLTDIQARAKENMKKADQLAIAKNELHNLKFKLEVEHDSRYSDEVIKLENEKSILEGRERNITSELEERQRKVDSAKQRKEELYKKWDDILATKLEFDPESFICPTCKREYDESKKEEMKQVFINNFNEHQKMEKEKINEEGKAINICLEENEGKINELNSNLKEVKEKLETINKTILEKQDEKEKLGKIDVTKLPQYEDKLKEVKALEEEVSKIAKSDTSEITNQKNEVINKINEIDKKLNERDVQEKTKNRIKELELEEEKISGQIQELESQDYQIEEFTKTKVKMLEEAINSKFKLVRFRLFDKQINGGLVECCDTLVNGVPYSDVNNAHKILAGLDIINTLSEFYNTTAPIFIDNKESINDLGQSNAQIISLIVTEDSSLRIEVI